MKVITWKKFESSSTLNWFDLEVQPNQREDEALEILNQIVEATQALGIFWMVNVDEWAGFWRCEGDMLVANDDLQLLTPDLSRNCQMNEAEENYGAYLAG